MIAGRNTQYLSLISILIMALAAATALADEKLEVPNTGFESAADGLPAEWTLAAEVADGNSVAVDSSVAHSGAGSLLISNAVPGSVTLMSAPVEMRVGHLYRLSGWLKTENAFSDGTAQYPTPVPACLTMMSFPFTNHSQPVGATRDWQRIEALFIATKKIDRLRVHLGYNGTATGKAWFDDLSLEKVDNIGAYIPMETVRWFGPGYRYDDRGWIFVHIEGEPYERGYQYGYLTSAEIVEYIRKLGVRQNRSDPEEGWNNVRFISEAFMLNRYEEEYQIEMKGIADGANRAGERWDGRPLDVVDICCINSSIDLGQMRSALRVTPNATSGINFLKTEDEMLLQEEYAKCSGLATTGSATDDGRFVFGQIFMWGGYTGVHWDVICDVDPSEGHRIVYHTFPGGLHSGADFYINDAGIVIGETTVRQTPYDDEGTPQSNRIRKAMQYSESIKDVVDIMTTRNNGQYTNEWPYADAKTDEVGIFLLGTKKWRLWRSVDGDFPAGLTDFYWCNNNNKDLEVRKEYIVNRDLEPYDLMFRPWNRDLAFNQFYHDNKGKIDSIAATELWASSPTNRAHACDGKITTGDMADQLVFLAHYGKLTLRHKFVGDRFIADLPGAKPHLSLGYSMPSPIFVTEKLRAARETMSRPAPHAAPSKTDYSAVANRYWINERDLWRGSVFPASQAESWLVSAGASYWQTLSSVPEGAVRAAAMIDHECESLNARYLYILSREGDVVPLETEERFDAYRFYEIPRIKGTFALHQLRLWLGNEVFLKVMREAYERYNEENITTDEFIAVADEVSGKATGPFLRQWIGRKGLPAPEVEVNKAQGAGGAWEVKLDIRQTGEAYHLLGSVDVECGDASYRLPIEFDGAEATVVLPVEAEPTRVVFNSGRDFPVGCGNFYEMADFVEDFHHTLMVYGTGRQIEANHTLAQRWQETVGDAYTEILVPLRKDCEITDKEIATHDLMVLGQPEDRDPRTRLCQTPPLTQLPQTLTILGASRRHQKWPLRDQTPGPGEPSWPMAPAVTPLRRR